MINSDCVFKIGSTHKVCEDYALTRKFIVDDKEMHVAVLADGCSSSECTDLGARILCHTFMTQIVNINDILDLAPQNVQNRMVNALDVLIDREDMEILDHNLDATLLAVVHYDDRFYIYKWGDGAVMIQTGIAKSLFNTEYNTNAPYYLSYRLSQYRKQMYTNLEGVVTTTNYIQWKDRTWHKTHRSDKPANCKLPWYFELCTNDIYSDVDIIVTLMSDGASSFNAQDPINVTKIADELTAFKNYRGEFVQRRVNKFIKRLVKEDALNNHFDDLAVASICKLRDKDGRDES